MTESTTLENYTSPVLRFHSKSQSKTDLKHFADRLGS